jgi:hypothetical protein
MKLSEMPAVLPLMAYCLITTSELTGNDYTLPAVTIIMIAIITINNKHGQRMQTLTQWLQPPTLSLVLCLIRPPVA